ncbi:MAG: prolyl aminopeptidase [Gammaproteobacteria bacterium]|nr:prolyl aminopeptidase [Gammaproteobacteria bacterium]NVK88066.1 prolyl aminopeptidase [Gammaproteobacteria bacterium]
MQVLFPEIKPYQSGFLDVGDGHHVFFEESGSKDGVPVLYIHGGPGTGSVSYHRRFFDPEKYRIILLDQRGCGQSKAKDALAANTTDHLLSDMEALREHLNLKRWVIFGGGWGATLALLYAQKYTERTLGLVLHSVFLGRQQDIDWIFDVGVPRLVPDYWEEFAQSLHATDRANLLDTFSSRLEGSDDLARMAAAKSWAIWYARSSLLHHSSAWIKRFNDPHVASTTARIQAHYFRHNCFIEDNQVLSDAHKLETVPGIIVHGRFDLLCPLDCAWQLQANWPTAELHIIRDACHANLDPGITDALVRAARDLHKMVTHDWSDSASD